MESRSDAALSHGMITRARRAAKRSDTASSHGVISRALSAVKKSKEIAHDYGLWSRDNKNLLSEGLDIVAFLAVAEGSLAGLLWLAAYFPPTGILIGLVVAGATGNFVEDSIALTRSAATTGAIYGFAGAALFKGLNMAPQLMRSCADACMDVCEDARRELAGEPALKR